MIKKIFTCVLFFLLASTIYAHSCDELNVSGAIDWRPVAYLDGKIKRGFAYDVIKMIGKDMNISITIQKENYPWKRMLDQVKFGELDAVTGIYWTQERSKKYYFSEPFAKVENVIFVKKGKEFPFEKFEDLIGRQGGNVLGGAIGGGFDEFKKKYLNIQEVPHNKMSFQKLILDRIDYIPLNYFEGIGLIKELGLVDKISILPKPLTSSPLRIAFSKKSPCVNLLLKINEIIQCRKKDGSIDRLIDESLKKTIIKK